jgi:hypothetical protein
LVAGSAVFDPQDGVAVSIRRLLASTSRIEGLTD